MSVLTDNGIALVPGLYRWQFDYREGAETP